MCFDTNEMNIHNERECRDAMKQLQTNVTFSALYMNWDKRYSTSYRHFWQTILDNNTPPLSGQKAPKSCANFRYMIVGLRKASETDRTLVVNAIAKVLGRQNSSLERLDLSNSCIEDDDCVRLAVALSKSTTLQDLRIQDNSIGERGARALGEALFRNQTLRKLALENNALGNEGCQAIARSLQSNSHLKSLNLGGNIIGTSGADALAKSLLHNKTLTSLTLTGTGLDSHGCTSIANALCKNTSLEKLHLEENGINDESANAVGNLMCKNKSITELRLEWNQLGRDACHKIVNSLPTNKALKHLSITYANDDDKLWDLLTIALQTNHTLQKFTARGYFGPIPRDVQISLYWNSRGPFEAEANKTEVFPRQELSSLDEMPDSCHVHAIERITQFENLSILFSMMRERPTFIDHCRAVSISSISSF